MGRMDTATPTSMSKSAAANGSLRRYILRYRAFYLMLIPGIAYFLLFKYVPLLGSVIAFQDYNIFKGFVNSDWVGFKWFEQFFTYPQFQRLIRNTLLISLYQLIFAFPAPIILAVLLNEVRNMAFKRTVQTIVYLPHFISWIIVAGLGYMLLSPQTGLINQLLLSFGREEPINFLYVKEYIRTIIVSAGIWKEMGWNAIIFLAALAGISPTLYEAARMDGAGRWKQFQHITLPGLLPAIMVLLLLKISNILDLGVEQVLPFLTPITFETGDILDTFTYREGIENQRAYSLTTAVGLFKSVLGFLLLIVANKASKATTGESIY